jgi:hypothetical protein
MKHKLIAVALIILLLSIVVVSNVCCNGEPTQYDLTTSSTAGGNVTAPGEGTYTYDEGDDVSLVATPDAGYRFVEWTGDVDDIDDVEDATTTITMNDDCAIIANFALGTLITDVPDTNQPPTQTIPSTVWTTQYCAPIAMVNVLGYWDAVMGHANAENLTAFQLPPNLNTVAEYLGYFMDTNNSGSPARVNPGPGPNGTYDVDIGPGTVEFIRWDAANLFLTPPPVLPAGKLGYDWTVTPDFGVVGLDFYTDEIDAGRPLVTCFDYWNPVTLGINYTDPETGEVIHVFKWGDEVPCSYYPNPEECWDDDIGHAVTGVGYILGWDPDGSGPEPSDDYVIVHDNWPTTPVNVAIPWAHWMSNHSADPGP